MFIIDQLAHANKLKTVHPAEKAVLALSTLVVCQAADSVVISLVVLALMTSLTVFYSGTPARIWVKMLALPGVFFALGAVSAITYLGLAETRALSGVSWTLGPLTMGVLPKQFPLALHLLVRGLASVSCLYFLVLTTPMVEILNLLRHIKVPSLLVELTELIYRFIFVLVDNAQAIYTAQEARLGYSSFARSLRSLGTLVVVLFVKSYHQATQLQWALEARGFDGELQVQARVFKASLVNWCGILFIEAILLTLAFISGGTN